MKSLRLQLIEYMKDRSEFTAKQEILDDIRAETTFSSEYILRELRKLREENRLEVKYLGKSKHAHYQYLESPQELFHLKMQGEHEAVYEQ